MKIALAQINNTIGDFDGNLGLIVQNIQKARQKKVDLIVFPELSLSGYPPRDLVEYRSFVDKNIQSLKELLQHAENISCIVGYVDRNPHIVGKKYVNAAALIVNGKIAGTYAKRLLPNYDVFDEQRYFESGKESGVFDFKGMKVGLTICEDFWNDKQFWKKGLYDFDPVQDQIGKGAQLLINIAASPFSLNKEDVRRHLMQSKARQYKVPVFYINLVGGNDELIFDGNSYVFDGKGHLIAEGLSFQEDFLIVDTEQLKPLSSMRKIDDSENLFNALVLGVRDYFKKCGFKQAVLGLSGGIDSALVAVIAVEALGADNVMGVLMPSMYSSQGSIKDAQDLARNLKISTEIISIEDIYKSYENVFKRLFPGRLPDITEENIQARIRGNLLMAISNKKGALLLSTGNKSELGVGYCTLYGDMSGGLSVISDLPKTAVYDVVRYLNGRQKIIPQAIVEKPPSAELKPNQKDQDSLPPYNLLDAILKCYVEDHLDFQQIVEQGYDFNTVKKVMELVDRSEFKRRQASPGLRVTEKAFGMGRRFPIARKISL